MAVPGQLARARAQIAELELKIGQQALELDFFLGHALQLMNEAGRRPSAPGDAPASTASSRPGRGPHAGCKFVERPQEYRGHASSRTATGRKQSRSTRAGRCANDARPLNRRSKAKALKTQRLSTQCNGALNWWQDIQSYGSPFIHFLKLIY